MSNLTVYKASAGSGKTFSLTSRYIGLLARNPAAYKQILAVTFTTKATQEMKTRILSQLYGLSRSLEESKDYLEEISSEERLSRGEISERAKTALGLILHDYGNFNVETIDSFFQRVLRGIARELDLNPNMKVELGQNEVEEMAVDRLVTSLDEKSPELKWIIEYIDRNIAEDKNWNVLESIKDFGKKIYAHEYKENSGEIARVTADDAFFRTFASEMYAIKNKAEGDMKKAGDGFMEILSGAGYAVEDLTRGKSGPAGYFIKLQNGNFANDGKILNSYVAKAMESPDGWVKKAGLGTPLHDLARERLTPYLNATEERRRETAKTYLSARAVLAHINEVRLLKRIEENVTEINRDNGCIMLSDTQDLLHGLMEGSDAPFIYEKTGSRISHIMIDEMQDTSVIQWENFKKLLLECLAQRWSKNLVVGDVKQSIYRWRNSDWSILKDIEREKDLEGKEILTRILDTNYRSEKNIVDFNNEFFCLAAGKERDRLSAEGNPAAGTIAGIYNRRETAQKTPDGKRAAGRVEIALLGHENYEEECIKAVAGRIDALLDEGVKEENIAVITRRNIDLEKIGSAMESLMRHENINFVSDEAFKLKNSTALNIIVNAMRLMSGKRTQCYWEYYGALLAWDYGVHILGKAHPRMSLHSEDDIKPLLPPDFVRRETELRAMPISAMAEEIGRIFGIDKLKEETAYVNAFFDYLGSFTRNNVPDVAGFVEYWDTTLSEKTVKGGDVKGVKMMTIHKAKGLEFDCVIVPFCDWELDKGNTLWCKTDVPPFSKMPVIPVDSKELGGTIYQREYYAEMLENAVDNLNLLYVAFTRARSGLFVVAKRGVTKDGVSNRYRSGLLETVLPELEEKLPGAVFETEGGGKDDAAAFTFGTLPPARKEKEEKTSSNIFTPVKEKEEVGMAPSSEECGFRQSNGSREFVAEGDEAEKERYITRGNIMHSLLSRIRDVDDVDAVLANFVQAGLIASPGDRKESESMAGLIERRVKKNRNPLVRSWFAPGVKVFNECTILSRDRESGRDRRLRPDRVMEQADGFTVVDFKFGVPKEEHKAQVRGYMRLLEEMGLDGVKGYLWYVYGNNVEEVLLPESV